MVERARVAVVTGASSGIGKAIAKAMGAPPGMMWHHCWIPRPDHGDGRPTVHLTGTVQAQAEALGITHWHLSLSHDGDVATAYVVAERRAACLVGRDEARAEVGDLREEAERGEVA